MRQAPFRNLVLDPKSGAVTVPWQRWLADFVRSFNDATDDLMSVGETPSGDMDGANTEFTIKFQPISGTLKYYQNGILQGDDDYVLNGKTITTTIPPVSSWHFALYEASSDIKSKFVDEVPDGEMDGINLLFDLTEAPVNDSLLYFVNGFLQREGVLYDYTLTDKRITTVVPPFNRQFATYQTVDGVPRYVFETPTGAIPGNTFTLTETPVPGALRYFRGGLLQKETQDYALTGNQVVTVLPLIDGEWHRAAYEVA